MIRPHLRAIYAWLASRRTHRPRPPRPSPMSEYLLGTSLLAWWGDWQDTMDVLPARALHRKLGSAQARILRAVPRCRDHAQATTLLQIAGELGSLRADLITTLPIGSAGVGDDGDE
jgi:hypothetical protein